jgi:hypothetical protein
VQTNYILIDYESVRVTSLALLTGEHFQVWVFLGPNNTRLEVPFVLAIQEFRERAVLITMKARGANALDFHIAYYLGLLAKGDPTGFFHIISKDTGFDPLIEHLKTKKISVARSVSIEAMPCFGPAKKAPGSTSEPTDEELLNRVIADLLKRKTAKPRTSKTLLSTIRQTCGKELTASKIEAVYEALVKRHYVTVEGTAVSYNLPVEP